MTSTKNRRVTTAAKRKQAPVPESKAQERKYQAAQAELTEMINRSGPFNRLYEELEQYPAKLFRQICKLYEERKAAVPDYALILVPYMGEMSLRALEETGLIEKSDQDIFSMSAYTPTTKGQKLWGRMEPERANKG